MDTFKNFRSVIQVATDSNVKELSKCSFKMKVFDQVYSLFTTIVTFLVKKSMFLKRLYLIGSIYTHQEGKCHYNARNPDFCEHLDKNE